MANLEGTERRADSLGDRGEARGNSCLEGGNSACKSFGSVGSPGRLRMRLHESLYCGA